MEWESPPNVFVRRQREIFNRNDSESEGSPDFGATQETLRQAQDNALHSDIICNANMRVGEIRQSCEFSEVDQ